MTETSLDRSGCGYGNCTPGWLQKLNNPKCLLLFLCIAAFWQGFIVNGLVSVVITTIEKQFSLSSSESGLIASSYDIASLICLLPVSYFGARRRNRYLSIGVAVLGFGSILFSIPHFVAGLYDPTKSGVADRCHLDGVPAEAKKECSSPLSRLRYFFIFSQLLHGAGSSPLYTIGVSYLDDSVKPKLSSVYIGIFYACSILGPAFGFLVGGQLLRVYVDFETVSRWPVKEIDLAWLGAWWVAFLGAGIIVVLFSAFIWMFPAELPNSADYKAQRHVETHNAVLDEEATRPSFGGSLKDLPSALKHLLINPTFLCLNFAAAADGFLVNGIAVYGPKVLQTQFGYPASTAALIMGVATIPMGCGGTLIGGYIVKKLKLSCIGVIKFCCGFTFPAFCCIFCFLIRCPDQQISNKLPGPTCFENCHCPTNRFDPVCDLKNQRIFYSACSAGCTGNLSRSRDWVFSECSCIGKSANLSIPVASRGFCSTNCGYLNYAFITVFAFGILFTFCTATPGVSATLRCVNEPLRPFAMGIQWMMIRALGAIPGPLIYGAIIDLVCSFWEQEDCEDGKQCRMYDNAGFSNAMFALAAVTKGLAVLFYFLAWLVYRQPKTDSPSETPELDVVKPS